MSRYSDRENELVEYLLQHPDVVAALLCNDPRRRRKGSKRLIYALSSIIAAGILFFALTPSGKAFASHAYHLMLKLADGVLYIQPAAENTANAVDPKGNTAAFHLVEPASFTDIQQASAYVQSPLLYVDAADAVIENIQVDSNEAMNTIVTTYSVGGQPAFNIRQTILKEGSEWGATMDVNGSQPVEKTLFNGETLLCATTHEGFAIGFSHWENFELFLSSATLKWDKLATYVDHLTYTNINQ